MAQALGQMHAVADAAGEAASQLHAPRSPLVAGMTLIPGPSLTAAWPHTMHNAACSATRAPLSQRRAPCRRVGGKCYGDSLFRGPTWGGCLPPTQICKASLTLAVEKPHPVTSEPGPGSEPETMLQKTRRAGARREPRASPLLRRDHVRVSSTFLPEALCTSAWKSVFLWGN